jgi:hypothetical protein
MQSGGLYRSRFKRQMRIESPDRVSDLQAAFLVYRPAKGAGSPALSQPKPAARQNHPRTPPAEWHWRVHLGANAGRRLRQGGQ